MSNIDEIMKIMETIEYGFLDKDGHNIFKDKDVSEKFSKSYYLISPKELLEKKVGVCWEQVELERMLFQEKGIKNETYFIYIDDANGLPSHTFLVYYDCNKVYWFEHSWYDEKGIHEYSNLNLLLNDVKEKFWKSRQDEVKHDLYNNIHIYKYDRPNYNISCSEFFNFIYTSQEIFPYKLVRATARDIDRIKDYKLQTITKYAANLSKSEKIKINNYITSSVNQLIYKYQNIIVNEKIIGSILIRNIKNGILLDEIFIEDKYRNKGIGTKVISNIILKYQKNIFLWVYKDNIKAFNLYKKLGFKIDSETKTRYYMKLC